METNKYHIILRRILEHCRRQCNRKGGIVYLLNEQLVLLPCDLLEIFEGHNIARKKLRSELSLFMRGERSADKYREAGINWLDYCGAILINSYPTYFERLPMLLARIKRGAAQLQKLCSFSGSDRSRDKSGSMPVACAVSGGGGATGHICISA